MDSLCDQLERATPGGYAVGGPLAAEPTAWATIALATAGRSDVAVRTANWLQAQQLRDGSVPVAPDADGPYWTTSLAVLAWHAVDPQRYAATIDLASRWLLATKGKTDPQHPYIGHNTTLAGWSWAANTHSWLEPTAFATMALTAAGYSNHPRTREAVRILVDRLLPDGGCNYGNTEILGQMLLPHLQPSGIVLWALAGQSATDSRIDASLKYLESEIRKPTGCASLAYALLALTAWNRCPDDADRLIEQAANRPATKGNCYKLALLALASKYTPAPSTA